MPCSILFLMALKTNGGEMTFISAFHLCVLRLEPGEGRFLVRLAPGKGYPKHRHPAVEKVIVLEGTYLDMGKEYGAGSYLNYPLNSVHAPISPTGYTIMVMTHKKPDILQEN